MARAEALTDQLVEAELLGTGHVDRAVQRRTQGDPADRLGDVVGRHGLNGHGWQPNRGPSVASSAMRVMNSKNCVVWAIEYGSRHV